MCGWPGTANIIRLGWEALKLGEREVQTTQLHLLAVILFATRPNTLHSGAIQVGLCLRGALQALVQLQPVLCLRQAVLGYCLGFLCARLLRGPRRSYEGSKGHLEQWKQVMWVRARPMAM